MLDDLKFIHEKDSGDALGIAERQVDQLTWEYETGQQKVEVQNIVYAGMGGSALAAEISRSWPGYDRPFELVKDYNIPRYVSESTYFIAASYSGNTEETLSALQQAESRGAKIAVITSGGKLADIARQKGYPLALLPEGQQPRYAMLYNLRALLELLVAAGLQQHECLKALAAARVFLRNSIASWLPTVPTARNAAKKLAQELIGQSVVIYAGPKLFPAAYKWKINFNENAKQLAWTDAYPEFSHNEFLGWTKQPVDKPYAIVELRSQLEHSHVQKRFEITERLLSGLRPMPHVVQVSGETILEQLIWSVAFGDFVSLYTAILSGINPTSVDLLEKYKQLMRS